ncbi:MAG: hypothetical protein QM493_00630 [Sulfurovum sp.]
MMFWVVWLIKIMYLEIDLRDKFLYIVDIRFKQKKFNISTYIDKNSEVLSLSPYSSFLLDRDNIEYITYHDIISIEVFKDKVLAEYRKIEYILNNYREYIFIFRDIAVIKTFEIYLAELFEFLDSKKMMKYKIVYITDSKHANNSVISDNSQSYIYLYDKIDKIVELNYKVNFFYKRYLIYSKLSLLFYKKNILKSLYRRFVNKLELMYDNRNYKKVYLELEEFDILTKLDTIKDIDSFAKKMKSLLIEKNTIKELSKQYSNILDNFSSSINYSNTNPTIRLHPFTFLSKMNNYMEILLYGKNKIPKIFMQHGSYFHENIFLKYGEIYPADINFVFNDFTKKLFEDRGAKKVYSVGSIDFNYPILEKEKEYDFLYITYCTSYSYSGLQIFSEDNIISVDGENIYTRHKIIIELFGERLTDKSICMKFQLNITSNMLYVPFIELSDRYSNVTIEFFKPISDLIGVSKYIISDYFSSAFINRELHFKRDIILFDYFLLVSDDMFDDMSKMFILVNSIDNLKEKILNIEKITKNRKRYDNIIEYYSSKKCNTKNIVSDIIKKELGVL